MSQLSLSRIACALVMLTIFLIANCVPVRAQLILDQKQENNGYGVTLGSGDRNGQEFMPALTPLAAVEVSVYARSGDCTLRARIREATIPQSNDGSILGTASKNVADGFSGWVRFDFSPAISVTPGQKYVIEISYLSGSSLTWWFGDNNPYPNGYSITYGVDFDDQDMMFRTYQEEPFDFSVSNSGGIAVAQGGSGSSTITITLTVGATHSVALSVSGLPSGASASFNPSSGNPTFTSILTIATSTTTPPGSYMITVSGTGSQTHTTTFTLTVNVRPVGGVVIPTNKLEILTPYLTLAGLVAAV